MEFQYFMQKSKGLSSLSLHRCPAKKNDENVDVKKQHEDDG